MTPALVVIPIGQTQNTTCAHLVHRLSIEAPIVDSKLIDIKDIEVDSAVSKTKRRNPKERSTCL